MSSSATRKYYKPTPKEATPITYKETWIPQYYIDPESGSPFVTGIWRAFNSFVEGHSFQQTALDRPLKGQMVTNQDLSELRHGTRVPSVSTFIKRQSPEKYITVHSNLVDGREVDPNKHIWTHFYQY